MRQPISVHEDSTACFSGGRTLVMRQPSSTRSSVAPAIPSAKEKPTVHQIQWLGSPKAIPASIAMTARMATINQPRRRPSTPPINGGSY